MQYSGKKPPEKRWKKIFKRFILCQKHYYWGIYNLQYHPKNCSRKLKAMIIYNVHLFLVIKPSYSCSFVTLLILACIDWLEDWYSSLQQFVKCITSWRRSFLLKEKKLEKNNHYLSIIIILLSLCEVQRWPSNSNDKTKFSQEIMMLTFWVHSVLI